MQRPTKITFAELCEQGVRTAPTTAAATPLRSAPTAGRIMSCLSDIEECFVCSACGKRGAEVRPDFTSAKPARQ
jgi:hypothetical protein